METRLEALESSFISIQGLQINHLLKQPVSVWMVEINYLGHARMRPSMTFKILPLPCFFQLEERNSVWAELVVSSARLRELTTMGPRSEKFSNIRQVRDAAGEIEPE